MTALQIYKHAFVNVAVATVWRSPGVVREIDRPAIKFPADPAAWLESMSYDNKLDLLGRVDTQCLYGEKVLVKKIANLWAQVEVLGQPGKNGKKAYPGWIPVRQLRANSELEEAQEQLHVVVTDFKTFLYDDENGSKEFLEVSYNTQLPLKDDSATSYQVITPEGYKWVKKEAAELLSRGHKPSGETLIQEGLRFLGLEYLWGGLSAWGFDCSGLAYTIHKRFGITIPRDADDQYYSSTSIAKENLQAGDLVFFAHDKGSGAIHHVGFYMGDGRMLHAPQTGKTVETLDLWSHEVFPDEFVGGCRFF